MTQPIRFIAVAILAMGCAGAHAPPRDHPGDVPPPPPLPQDATNITLTGQLTAMGPAHGKSLAAWNGFELGEEVYRFSPIKEERIERIASDFLLVHAPAELDMKPLLGVPVRVTGTWHVPAPVEMNPQMQMPVSTGREGQLPVQREPTLRALTIEPLDSL